MKKNCWIGIVVLAVNLVVSIGYLNKSEVAGIVVPHHNVVAEKRLEFFHLIDSKKKGIKRVVVISPDHFGNNQRGISYADRSWNLSKGVLNYDEELGNFLTEGMSKDNNLARQDPTSFLDLLARLLSRASHSEISLGAGNAEELKKLEEKYTKMSRNNNLVRNDHGIFNILGDIREVFGEVKIVPILIGQEVELEKLDDLVEKIDKNCKGDCLLITSVDFSHYLPYKLANIHDVKTERHLANLEKFEMKELEVDSPQSLYVLTELARKRKAVWTKFWHSNSAEMMGMEDLESTSHFMGWYEDSLKFKMKNLKLIGDKKKNENYTLCVGRVGQKWGRNGVIASSDEILLPLKRDQDDIINERFWYGVDYMNFDLQTELNLNGELEFKLSDKSYINKKEIGVAENMVVCGVVGEEMVFSSFDRENGELILTNGE